jgi:hypothetical protein
MEGSLTLKNPNRELFFLPVGPYAPGEPADRSELAAGDRDPKEGASEGDGEARLVANVSEVKAVPVELVDIRDPVVEVSMLELR